MARGGEVLPLRLTAAVATRRINEAAGKSGSIGLGNPARDMMAEIGFSHPALALFLTTARVVGEPQAVDGVPGAWRCRVEGFVRSADAGARTTLVLLGGKVFVEMVEWL